MKDPSRTYGLRVTVVATGDILSCHSSDSNETNRLFLIFFLVGGGGGVGIFGTRISSLGRPGRIITVGCCGDFCGCWFGVRGFSLIILCLMKNLTTKNDRFSFACLP